MNAKNLENFRHQWQDLEKVEIFAMNFYSHKEYWEKGFKLWFLQNDLTFQSFNSGVQNWFADSEILT